MMESKILVWDYFEKLPNGKSSCKTCRKELPCTSGNTSSLGRHLNIYHQKLAKVCIILISVLIITIIYYYQEFELSTRQRRGGEMTEVREEVPGRDQEKTSSNPTSTRSCKIGLTKL